MLGSIYTALILGAFLFFVGCVIYYFYKQKGDKK